MDIRETGLSDIKFSGKGPGAQTVDGCSVEFYLKLKAGTTPKLIAENVKAAAEILELGCGVGRITRGLIQLGFHVTAVDNSIEMLGHVCGAETVCSDIESLELNKEFDAVVLASYLINIPNQNIRKDLLGTCRKHLKDDGILLIEAHPYTMLDRISTGYKGESDGVKTYVDVLERDGSILKLEIHWEIDGQIWSQSFVTEVIDDAQIQGMLHDSNLKFVKWLDDNRSWFSARIE